MSNYKITRTRYGSGWLEEFNAALAILDISEDPKLTSLGIEAEESRLIITIRSRIELSKLLTKDGLLLFL